MLRGTLQDASAGVRLLACVVYGGLAAVIAGLIDWLIGGDASVSFVVLSAAFLSVFMFLMSQLQRGHEPLRGTRAGRTGHGRPTVARPLSRQEWRALAGCALTVAVSLVIVDLSQAVLVLFVGVLLDLVAAVGLLAVLLRHRHCPRQRRAVDGA